jgi:hypothetical protein
VTFTRRTETARRQAGARILDLIDQVRVRFGQPGLSPEQAEAIIDEEVKTVRRARRRHNRHD